jgi:hypothetical protein
MEKQPPDMKGICKFIEKNSRGQPTKGDPSAYGLGDVLTTPHCKNLTTLRTRHKILTIGLDQSGLG